MQLSMGQPGAALRQFDSYVAAGGPLLLEARYGRIRALTAMGRNADAEKAKQEFLDLYPTSVQARALRSDSPR
jgi:hypothetical protein